MITNSKYVSDAHRARQLSQIVGRNDADALGRALDDMVELIVPLMKRCPNGYDTSGFKGSRNNRPAIRTAASMCYERLVSREGVSARTAEDLTDLAVELARSIAKIDYDSEWRRASRIVREIHSMASAS